MISLPWCPMGPQVELHHQPTEGGPVYDRQVKQQHWTDPDGKPAGGVANGIGFYIEWQNGPLGRGEDRKEPNGAFVCDILEAALGRLDHFQGGAFRCRENAIAITKIEEALLWLGKRRAEREARGVEGTHGK